jgi:hypothetical protein
MTDAQILALELYVARLDAIGQPPLTSQLRAAAETIRSLTTVRSQAKDSRKAKVEQSEFDEELSEQEGRLSL